MNDCVRSLPYFTKFLEQGIVVVTPPRVDCIGAVAESSKLLPNHHANDVLTLLFQPHHYLGAQLALIAKHEPVQRLTRQIVCFKQKRRHGSFPGRNVEPICDVLLLTQRFSARIKGLALLPRFNPVSLTLKGIPWYGDAMTLLINIES